MKHQFVSIFLHFVSDVLFKFHLFFLAEMKARLCLHTKCWLSSSVCLLTDPVISAISQSFEISDSIFRSHINVAAFIYLCTACVTDIISAIFLCELLCMRHE